MAKQPVPKPQPVVTETVCSLCDEEWSAHGDNPSVLDCIRILKAKRFTPSPSVAPVVTWGYTCSRCGVWVTNGQYHGCWSVPNAWWLSTAGNTTTGATLEITSTN